MTPMRVLVVSNMYPAPEHPAGGIFVHEQVKALRQAGVDARVLTGQSLWLPSRRPRTAWTAIQGERTARRQPTAFAEHDGVPVLRFRYLAGAFVPPWLYPWIYRRAVTRLLPVIARTFPYDLVHTHTAFLDGRAGAAAAALRRVPMVLTEHTGPLSLVTARRLFRLHTAAGLRAATRIVAVSAALRAQILAQVGGLSAGNIVVIPNGVDTRFFDPDRLTDAAPAAAPLPGPDPSATAIRAVWVGHHVEVKRVDRLLDAFAIAVRREPRLHLTLVGSGPLADAMKGRAQALGVAGAVTFAPGASRAGVRQHLAQSDFLVLSSETETFGVVGIEAMAMGLPVLATRCGGPEDYLDDTTGVLVDNTMEDLAIGFGRMAARLATVDRAAIRATAVRRFDFAVVARAIIALYEDLLAAATRGAAA